MKCPSFSDLAVILFYCCHSKFWILASPCLGGTFEESKTFLNLKNIWLFVPLQPNTADTDGKQRTKVMDQQYTVAILHAACNNWYKNKFQFTWKRTIYSCCCQRLSNTIIFRPLKDAHFPLSITYNPNKSWQTNINQKHGTEIARRWRRCCITVAGCSKRCTGPGCSPGTAGSTGCSCSTAAGSWPAADCCTCCWWIPAAFVGGPVDRHKQKCCFFKRKSLVVIAVKLKVLVLLEYMEYGAIQHYPIKHDILFCFLLSRKPMWSHQAKATTWVSVIYCERVQSAETQGRQIEHFCSKLRTPLL